MYNERGHHWGRVLLYICQNPAEVASFEEDVRTDNQILTYKIELNFTKHQT